MIHSTESTVTTSRDQFNHVKFEDLLKCFTPVISKLAKNYPPKWQGDLTQEGSIALYNASKKFIILPLLDDFRPYANKAIKRRMIDFYRIHIMRSPITEDIHSTMIDSDYDETTELISNFTAEPEFVTTTDFELDYQIIFSEGTLKANSFLPIEIDVIKLNMSFDFNVTEIAEQMNVSVGQASKILTRAKAKSAQLWTVYNNYELKHI